MITTRRRKMAAPFAALLITALFAGPGTGANAQEAGVRETSAGETSQATTQVSGWKAQCASASRSADLNCKIEQGIFLSETGQQLANVSFHVPGDTSKPELVIQLPHGLHLPSGVQLQFDDGAPENHQVHTCDANGCYVAVQKAARMVVSMKGGTNFTIKFKNLSLNEISVTMPLEGFTAAYKNAE